MTVENFSSNGYDEAVLSPEAESATEAPSEVPEASTRALGSLSITEAGGVADATLDGRRRGPDGHENYHT